MRYWRSCMIGIGIRLHHRDARRSFTKHQVSRHLGHPGEQTLGGYGLQRTIIDAHFTMSQTRVCTVSWGEPNCFFNIAGSHWLPPTSTFASFRLNLKTPYIHYYQNQNAKHIQNSGRGYWRTFEQWYRQDEASDEQTKGAQPDQDICSYPGYNTSHN